MRKRFINNYEHEHIYINIIIKKINQKLVLKVLIIIEFYSGLGFV